MNWKIIRKEVLSDQEQQTLLEWDNDLFGMGSAGFDWIQWRDAETRFIGYEDNQPVSHVGVLNHLLAAKGNPLKIGGIVEVVTIPHARNKGYAQKLLHEAIEYMRQEIHSDFGLLFCMPAVVPYYNRLGWHLIENIIIFEQDSGKVKSPLPSMIYPLSNKQWPKEDVLLGCRPW